MKLELQPESRPQLRENEIFFSRYHELARKTDRLFGYLFGFQWVLGIVFAALISPKTWSGEYSETHIHIYAAVFLGGLIAFLPMWLIFTRPGATLNRMIVAVSQILFSVLFIHLTGGRIETHFHVFGSLAFLAFYRDWRPVLIGTIVTTVDHLVRGAFWPQSVYGVLNATPWRAFEHAAWVIFEDFILLNSIKLAVGELRSVSKSQADLEKTAAIAEKANQAKSLFLANISHELRTPMHGVLSFAKFGQEKIEDSSKETLKSYFDEIYDSGSRLMYLLNDLLDLSKLESGKMNYTMEDEDLIDVVRSVQAEVNVLTIEKKLKIELVTEKSSLQGVFDRERIAQVIRNLLSNAIKFSEKSTKITILLDSYLEKNRCCVINRGVGIPMSELELIFDKFVQSSKTRTGAGGTGLGLAICKEIIEQHGGKIWAESTVSGESKFIFELPIKK